MPSILRTKRTSRPPPLDTATLDTSEFGATPTKANNTYTTSSTNTSTKSSDRSTPLYKPETPRLVVTRDSNAFLVPHSDSRASMNDEPDALSPTATNGRTVNRDSMVQRVADRLNSPNGDVKKSKSRRSRRASTSSAISQGQAVSTVVKSGLQVAVPGGEEVPKAGRVVSVGRSPYLLTQDSDSDDNDDSGDESDHVSDVEAHLPVTGFAVASNRRNAEFHGMFPTVDGGDYLIEDYGCALAKDILVHGRLYVSENHICFHSNLFGWVTDLIIPFSDVQQIEKKMTALVIPNAIGITTSKETYTFASLISRDSTFDVLMNVWRIAHPGAVMPTSSTTNGAASRPESVAEGSVCPPATAAHTSTECACGKAGKHYAETALDTTFSSSPEKVYNLVFNSGWNRTFLSENQKLRDIQASDWRPNEDKVLSRSMTYIKPLGGSIGPKQTKCHIVDDLEHCDYDQYISMVTTTRTPDVPSGGVFSVKTRTCFTWASASTTRVVVTTEVEWTGKSWVKGIIEKSAIDGQKQFHDDLAKEMRAHMKEHPTEFAVAGAEGIDEAEEAAPEPAPTEAQEYAAQNRRARQDADFWMLQGSFDSVLAGAKSIVQGMGIAFNTISDLLADIPLSKGSLMVSVIVLLMASNIYTYVTRPTSLHKAKRIQRFGPSEDDVAEAVRIILAKRAATTPKEEVAELIRLLDEIDARSSKLRALFITTHESPIDALD